MYYQIVLRYVFKNFKLYESFILEIFRHFKTQKNE